MGALFEQSTHGSGHLPSLIHKATYIIIACKNCSIKQHIWMLCDHKLHLYSFLYYPLLSTCDVQPTLFAICVNAIDPNVELCSHA